MTLEHSNDADDSPDLRAQTAGAVHLTSSLATLAACVRLDAVAVDAASGAGAAIACEAFKQTSSTNHCIVVTMRSWPTVPI